MIDFAAVADHQRLKRSALLFGSAALVALGLLLVDANTAIALLQRQFLFDVDIPRATSIAAMGTEIWPSGEEVKLTFDVRGPGLTASQAGSVRVSASDDRTFSVPLTFEATTSDETATYTARVPPGSADFTYMAKIGDGRTRSPSRVHYVNRPSVTKQDAYVILPAYVGLRPDGTPYEQAHLRGDIVGMKGLSVRVAMHTQKPIVRAVLETHGSQYPDLSGAGGLTRIHELNSRMLASLSAATMAQGPPGPLAALCTANAASANVPLRRFEQVFSTPTDSAQWCFDLRATETSYRVTVFDEYGFASKTESVAPSRSSRNRRRL